MLPRALAYNKTVKSSSRLGTLLKLVGACEIDNNKLIERIQTMGEHNPVIWLGNTEPSVEF